MHRIFFYLFSLSFSTLEVKDIAVAPASKKGQKTRKEVELPKDVDGYVVVYTDGSCLNNGKPNAAAGIGVWFDDGHPL